MDIPERLFPTRDAFRAWLMENSETSGGIWLVFGKAKAVVSLSANDALEEARERDWEKIIDRLNKNLKPM